MPSNDFLAGLIAQQLHLHGKLLPDGRLAVPPGEFVSAVMALDIFRQAPQGRGDAAAADDGDAAQSAAEAREEGRERGRKERAQRERSADLWRR